MNYLHSEPPYDIDCIYFYDPAENLFKDENDKIIIDTGRKIGVNNILIFKDKQQDMLVKNPEGKMVGLVYPLLTYSDIFDLL